MGIICAAEGATRMRAVGANKRTDCKQDLDVGGRKACASRGLLLAKACRHSTAQRELLLSPAS